MDTCEVCKETKTDVQPETVNIRICAENDYGTRKCSPPLANPSLLICSDCLRSAEGRLDWETR